MLSVWCFQCDHFYSISVGHVSLVAIIGTAVLVKETHCDSFVKIKHPYMKYTSAQSWIAVISWGTSQ